MKTLLLLLLSLGVCWPALQSRVWISSSRTQYFEYENVTLVCEGSSAGDWNVWRYTDTQMSRCGCVWGVQSSSSCRVTTVKMADSGVYWCESSHRESSNAVNITVSVGDLVLGSPAGPVTEGRDVTLTCISSKTSDPTDLTNVTAAFFRGSTHIGQGQSFTVPNFSRSHEGRYSCTANGKTSPASWLLVNGDTGPVSLTVTPDSSQLYEYDNLSLSCGTNSSSGGWKVVRSQTISGSGSGTGPASGGKVVACGDVWGRTNLDSCTIDTAKRADSATYWCQSQTKQRSNSVTVTVYDSSVILQTPVRPVLEGTEVTLTCRNKTTSDLLANFSRDGDFVLTAPSGNMTIHNVSKRDEGLYVCVVDGTESPPSWLFVTEEGGASSSGASSSGVWVRLILHLVVFCPYLIATVLMVSLFRQQAGRKRPVSMTMSPLGESDAGSDHPYDDAVAANVTTEYHF